MGAAKSLMATLANPVIWVVDRRASAAPNAAQQP
jgi:hypothetical protein